MPEPAVSIIVPACRDDANLRRVLDGVDALSPKPAHVVIADDGSPAAEVGALAQARGHASVRVNESPAGPAAARNAAAASLPVHPDHWLLFIDADVVPHPDTVAELHRAIAAADDNDDDDDSQLVSVFGSYDANPPAPGAASRYANLRHHHVHTTNPGPASTFWAGLGAIRSDAFANAGGFDAARFPRPSIEDIELGMRLHAAGGRLLIHPPMRGTHLKRWTLSNLWRTEVRDRALPWARLLQQTGSTHRPLNLNRTAQLSAACAGLHLLCLLAATTCGLALLAAPAQAGGPTLNAAALLAAALTLTTGAALAFLQRGLFATLFRHSPPWQWPAHWLLHALHLTYSAAAFVWVRLTHRRGAAGA